jgi:hypothetical protein
MSTPASTTWVATTIRPSRGSGAASSAEPAPVGRAEARVEQDDLSPGDPAPDKGAEELDLVKHPEGVGVQQAEVDRPAEAALAVAAHHRTREQLIERAHQNRIALGKIDPVAVEGAAHSWWI